ncbi:BrxA/BrxB family bacilliredoxin [Marinoscillum furvescens]|uniref:Putative YphP/YqiW family bacilliredoxin n=1 Tax=Marinoscillum furvescens DSM 4134 TaxID=1122208 RepID=A0A3D9L1L5_MARFU|nr:BrxA/BrxB family bacilliredoxin [Marinoscillum furvescens]RED96985.1 putative YphP/YqiW family bacilliredoxin [Marinoscillum furvescens DSM 4134]
MYPEELVAPMRSELTQVGFEEFKSAADVENHLKDHKGTTLLVINSVCGCAAGTCRPGVSSALNLSSKKPDHLATVFAGVDKEATAKAREFTMPFPPSSPSIALFKDGELVHFVERHHIEGRSAEMIANHLVEVFKEFC